MNAIARLPADVGWVQPTGASVFASNATIPSGPQTAIASTADGCSNGTGQHGAVGPLTQWTAAGTLACSSKAHYLCFGL